MDETTSGQQLPAELRSTVEGDPEELLNGGPTRTPGMMTTTGGTAGPNSFKPRANHGPGVAPTTTGDATTGGFTSEPGATSDASTAI